jgi:hypothetical protein
MDVPNARGVGGCAGAFDVIATFVGEAKIDDRRKAHPGNLGHSLCRDRTGAGDRRANAGEVPNAFHLFPRDLLPKGGANAHAGKDKGGDSEDWYAHEQLHS